MLFTSVGFIAFLAVGVFLYYLPPAKYQARTQWPLLLAMSLYFYWRIAHRLLLAVLFSAAAAWGLALAVEWVKGREAAAVKAVRDAGGSRQERQEAKRRYLPLRRLFLAAFLLCCVGTLLLFKFYDPFAQLLAAAGPRLPMLRLVLPLGISFYTLSLTSYFVDVYKGQATAERDPARVLLFTCFFPAIMQGPICRWQQTSQQLFSRHALRYDALVLGCERMLWGYFKKLVIADRLNVLTTTLYEGYAQYQGFYVVVAAMAYTVQLYTDFSGGIDIALGAAELFGIELPQNFSRPLFSKSISEFWRRWNITLGAFLRDYIFYPLTFCAPAMRCAKFLRKHKLGAAAKWGPTCVAMAITWFISGVWHGVGMQFIWNGFWHGALILLGEITAEHSARLWKKLRVPANSTTLRAFRVMRTFCLVAIGEIMFRSNDMAMMVGMLRGMVAVFNPWILFDGSLLALGLDAPDLAVAVIAVLVLFAVSLMARSRDMRQWLNRQELPIRWGILLAGIAVICVFGVYGPEYDPAPFIYFQF